MKTLLTMLALALPAPALAATVTLDLAEIADAYEDSTGREGTWAEATGGDVVRGGVTVSLSSPNGDVWMDTDFGRNATPGAGVCTAPCDRDPQDSIFPGETLIVSFSRSVDLLSAFLRHTPLAFDLQGRGPDHVPYSGGALFNGVAVTAVDGFVNLSGLGSVSTLSLTPFTDATDEPRLYLTSVTFETGSTGPAIVPTPIPLPAAGVLLLAGMGGLAALRTRRR